MHVRSVAVVVGLLKSSVLCLYIQYVYVCIFQIKAADTHVVLQRLGLSNLKCCRAFHVHFYVQIAVL